MAGVNKVILIGNLGRDPEVRTLESGAKVANFSLATTESYRNREGERVEHTEWHNLVLWRGLAEIAEKYLSKGNSIYVEGRIRARSYEDKDKVKKYITEIQVDNLNMLGGRRDNNAPAAENGQAEANATEAASDDLPF